MDTEDKHSDKRVNTLSPQLLLSRWHDGAELYFETARRSSSSQTVDWYIHAAECSPDLSRVRYLRGRPQQQEKDLVVAGGGGANIREDPDGWVATDNLTVVLETSGLIATELSAYRVARSLYTVVLERWRPPSQNCIEKPLFTFKEQ